MPTYDDNFWLSMESQPSATAPAQPAPSANMPAPPYAAPPYAAPPVAAPPPYAGPPAFPGAAAQQYAAQPYPAQPYAAQPYPAQPYAAQPYAAQPYAAQAAAPPAPTPTPYGNAAAPYPAAPYGNAGYAPPGYRGAPDAPWDNPDFALASARTYGGGGARGGALIFAMGAGLVVLVFMAFSFRSLGSGLGGGDTKLTDLMAQVSVTDLAGGQELFRAKHGRYGTLDELTAQSYYEPRESLVVTVVRADEQGYCLSAKHKQGKHVYYVDSVRGPMPPDVACS